MQDFVNVYEIQCKRLIILCSLLHDQSSKCLGSVLPQYFVRSPPPPSLKGDAEWDIDRCPECQKMVPTSPQGFHSLRLRIKARKYSSET